MSLFSCAGKRPLNLGISDSQFTACPSSPNCVSSDAKEGNSHYIPGFQLKTSLIDAWQVAKELVVELPRTQIILQTDDYLHAECTSAIFGFVDDLELHLRPHDKVIAVRSASRLGSSDFGVNRNRIENLRDSLKKRNVIR